MIGYKIKKGNELYIEMNLWEYVKIINNTAEVYFPEIIQPKLISNSYVKLWYTTINPRLVYNGTAHQTINGWNYLTSEGLPLEYSTTLLAMDEILRCVYTRTLPIISQLVYILELSDFTYYLKRKEVEGTRDKVNEITRKIRGYLRQINKRRSKLKQADKIKSKEVRQSIQKEILIRISSLKKELASIASELKVAKELNDLGFHVSFSSKSLHGQKPDLCLNWNGRIIEVEVSKRYEPIIMSQFLFKKGKECIVSLNAFLKEISQNLWSKIEEKRRQGDVIIIDISSIPEGFILSCWKEFAKDPSKLDLNYAINQALSILQLGEKPTIIYSSVGNTSAAVCITCKNTTLENIRIRFHEFISSPIKLKSILGK